MPFDIDQAIETFVRGHATTKSLTHPYEVLRFGKVWAMRDAQRKNPKNYRKEEWIGAIVEPSELIRVATQQTRGWHFLGKIVSQTEDFKSIRDQFKALGYRLLSTEPMFVHSLERIPTKKSPAKVVRMMNESQSLEYAKEARIRPLPRSVLSKNSPWRHYLAIVDSQVVGWVSSIHTPTGSTWCSNLVVREAFRRQGIGSALLSNMLRDDRKYSAHAAVLLSSHTGALIYPRLGFQQTGTLLILAPQKQRRL